jgi:hypothetical protein
MPNITWLLSTTPTLTLATLGYALIKRFSFPKSFSSSFTCHTPWSATCPIPLSIIPIQSSTGCFQFSCFPSNFWLKHEWHFLRKFFLTAQSEKKIYSLLSQKKIISALFWSVSCFLIIYLPMFYLYIAYFVQYCMKSGYIGNHSKPRNLYRALQINKHNEIIAEWINKKHWNS